MIISIFDGDKTTLVNMQETVIRIDTNTNMATYIIREYIFEKHYRTNTRDIAS